jgi:hypothetical protein
MIPFVGCEESSAMTPDIKRRKCFAMFGDEVIE